MLGLSRLGLLAGLLALGACTAPRDAADGNRVSSFRESCNKITGVTLGPARYDTPIYVSSAQDAAVGIGLNLVMVGFCLATR
jgi:hypothetical protein